MAKPKPSRYAAALQYLQQMRDRAADFGGGVVDTLADRARDVGGLAYEAFTSDPNIGRMTTAEFSQAADRPTPRLDQAAQDLGTIGKAIVTQPVQTGKALVQGEVERARQAMTSPRAAGEYAGSMVDPMRIAAALRKTAPIAELDVYHGTPHRFPETETNPLGEFDASKIGTGEGAQAYGHGIYFAEAPQVAEGYKKTLSKSMTDGAQRRLQAAGGDIDKAISEASAKAEKYRQGGANSYHSAIEEDLRGLQQYKQAGKFESGSLYKADLPDDMIDRMLDWEKPLSEQSEFVKAAIRAMPNAPDESKWKNWTGEYLYRIHLQRGGRESPEKPLKVTASEKLQNASIPGIKYLDAGSRSRGLSATGTRNFVVFPGEEKKVRILERDGQKAPPQKIAQALEAAPQGGKVVGIRSRQTAKMANRINEAMGGGPQPLSDNVQREMKLATSVLQSKNPQAVEDWIQAYYNADLPMEQFEAATGNLRKTLLPETVNALIQNAGTFRTADQFKAFLNATPEERAKQLAKVSK